jgi:predicted ATPase
VARICQLVEGMPLALELAAAWVHLLSCRDIVQEIERNLDFLSISARDLPERHCSMRAVFDYSWQMLSAEEQRVLCRLSVSRGGFLREAAEQVAGASLSLLSALVTRSLVRRTLAGRYDVHELVRQYTADRLENAKEERLFAMSTCAILSDSPRRRSQAAGAEQLAPADRLENEHENLRVALEWSLRDQALDAQESLRLTGALHLFWKRRALWSEGRDWLTRALVQSADLQVTREWVKALNAAALLAADQADTRRHGDCARESGFASWGLRSIVARAQFSRLSTMEEKGFRRRSRILRASIGIMPRTG